MNFTSYLYIFALAILCNPGLFIKDKSPHNILYSLVFTLILYITFDFVNKYSENYEQYNVDVKGVDSLVNLIKTQGGENEPKKIDINNHLFQEDGTDQAICWTALGNNQKELEIIKVQLDSYFGSKNSIDMLNNQLELQKQEIENLQEQLKGVEGSKIEIDQINNQIKNYQSEIDKLKQQLSLYNETEKTIGEVNNQIYKVQTSITDLNTKIASCNTLNSGKEENITTLTGSISEQESTITSLESRKTSLTNDIASQNNTISDLLSIKKNRTGCLSPVYDLGAATDGPWNLKMSIWYYNNAYYLIKANPRWIWWTPNARTSAPSTGKNYIYKYNNPGYPHLIIYVTADNGFKLYVNGNYISENNEWQTISAIKVSLTEGINEFKFNAWNNVNNSPAGLIVASYDPNRNVAFISKSSGWGYE